MNNLSKLQELQIGKGFEHKLAEIVAGPSGCTHMCEIVREIVGLTLFTANTARLYKIDERSESPNEQMERVKREIPWLESSCLAMKRSESVKKIY